MASLKTDSAPLDGALTPNLDRLLKRLGGMLRRNIWLHGLGTALAAGALWLTFMYVADRSLKLPAAIRVIHLIVLIGGVIWILRRTLFQHTKNVPTNAGLAMLAQRALPDDLPRDDRFVSAIQLRNAVGADSPSAPLVRGVARAAEDFVPKVDLARVTDSKGPVGRVAGGLVGLGVAAAALGYQPAMASIFGQRMLGQNVAWPRATTLILDVPDGGGALDVQRPSFDLIEVRAARGSDVPIVILAEGEVPEVVTVKFDSGAAIDLSPSGNDTFRTVLPSVQEGLELRVYGGDDQRGEQTVRIEVLQPPDLASLAFVIVPPAYSGLPSRTERDTAIAVLAGSTVSVIAATDPDDATGLARTFPNDEEIALARVPFPAVLSSKAPGNPQDPSSAEGAAPVRTGLGFERTVLESLRFRFELTDSSGLSNPDPALFGIEVMPDRRPELITLQPGRAEVETIAGGAVPLRVLVRDDFGLDTFRFEIRNATSDDVLATTELPLADAPLALEGQGRVVRAAGVATALLEVNTLRPDGAMEEGQVVTLQTFVLDSRSPEANETRSAPIRVRVVSADEFLRTQRDGLGRAAEDVGQVSTRLTSSVTRMDEFTMAMDGDDAEAPTPSDVTGLVNDARRMQGDLTSIGRELSGLASSLIYTRMDERAGTLEARLFELNTSSTDRSFQPEIWTTLSAEVASGQLGSPERAGELVRLVGMALAAAGPQTDGLIASLETMRSEAATDEPLNGSRAALKDAMAQAQQLNRSIETLMNDLGEWDNMQAIISLTRDIANRQKNILEKVRIGAESGK